MSSAAVSTHSGAGPLSLMSCVRESSPLQDFDSDTEKNVATKKKFWNRIKWFKRKNKVIEDNVMPVSEYLPSESLRSRSTSELSIEEPPRKRNGSSMYPGLSVSHDSVFHSPQSGSETDLDVAHSSSSLCIPNQPHADLQTELSERLRLRRSGGGRGDTSEDDEGLPHSPCNSPTTTDTLDKTALKDLPNKSHSTCSDGSLLSVGSSDLDEDLVRNTSKSSATESDLDLSATSIPLNHSAAHHRVAVRPKKTHGVPRKKRIQQLPNTLPTTIEVNEESSVRSVSPEIKVPPPLDNKLNRSKSNAGSKSQDGLEENNEKEEKCDKSFFERLFPRRSAKKKKSKNEDKQKQEEKKIKLEIEDKKKHEEFKITTEKYSIRDDTSNYYKQIENSSYRRYESKPIPAVRSGAAYRQRVLPIDIPDSPETFRKDEEISPTKIQQQTQLPDVISTSPLQLELENKLKQRLTRSSPPKNVDILDIPEIEIIPEEEKKEIETPKTPTILYFENKKFEDSKHKIKLAGLSSLQQKVLTLNEDEGDYHNFKSLTEFPSMQKTNVLLTKSHSFKTTTTTTKNSTSIKNILNVDESKDISIGKSSSLDSVKMLESEKLELFTEKIEHQKDIKNETIEFKCDITVGENDNLDEEISKYLMETKNLCDSYDKSHITISGPSHTAVVNIKNHKDEETKVTSEKNSPLISITKINVQTEEDEISTPSPVGSSNDTKPLIVGKSPKKIDQSNLPKSMFNFDLPPRKFSKEDVEIIDKDDNEELVEIPKVSPVFTISPATTPTYKKNEKTFKKSSVVSITPDSPIKDKSIISCKSSSLDSLTSDQMDSTDKSSQDSLDNIIDKTINQKEKLDGGVVLRKKSSVKENKDEEPELMKVFARRSLKLRDCENENLSQQLSVMINENCDKTRDSDKENQITDSPIKERKKSTTTFKEYKIDELLNLRRKSNDDENDDELKKSIEEKELLIESNVIHSKPIPIRRNSGNDNTLITDNTEKIEYRKNTEQRSISMSLTKSIDNSQNLLRKQFVNRRRTDNWITNIKNEGNDKNNKDEDTSQQQIKDETINELIIETKNFNQRKAEWEKRAQEAQKKSTP